MQYNLFTSFARLPLIFRVLIISLLLIFSFGMIVHLLEPEQFTTIFEGIWWAVVTAATVGYGDFAPKTVMGRIAGIALIMIGAGFLASYFVTLATVAVTKQNDLIEGRLAFKGKNHLIIIGWNERSREILQALCKNNKDSSFTLIDESLEANPLPDKNVHFIQGRSNLDAVLIKANIFEASKVIITADPNKGELAADMSSILTLLTVKGLNPHIPCIVEILTSEQVANAKRAGADEVVQTNILTSFVMINSISSQELVTSFLDLLRQLDNRKLTLKQVPETIIDMSYMELSQLLIQDGILLLGIKRGEDTTLNPPHPFTIKADDQLIVITN
ncbi:TrkA family potassium uptake protein [Bacillus sp. S/N-304-OC-R1]|uniref:potassium channel family protein n=1 Tax=Bacillus sp. S/N-304-OC-R1 TaxID=2758034 RepID=UPI001C8E84A7|nr:potassium channel family protein [Bacillus sp. S/N-304-OC-R1]MBY0124307.1 potassium channel family protein [Bacillus sp. S/N-304-OC-R1]